MSTAEPEARILVIDDEPMIVELLAVSVRFQGFDVVTAISWTDGLDKARRFRPDALIVDVMMPGMDRFGLLRLPRYFMVRRKVDTTEPKLIHTLRSVGYVLRAPQPSRK